MAKTGDAPVNRPSRGEERGHLGAEAGRGLALYDRFGGGQTHSRSAGPRRRRFDFLRLCRRHVFPLILLPACAVPTATPAPSATPTPDPISGLSGEQQRALEWLQVLVGPHMVDALIAEVRAFEAGPEPGDCPLDVTTRVGNWSSGCHGEERTGTRTTTETVFPTACGPGGYSAQGELLHVTEVSSCTSWDDSASSDLSQLDGTAWIVSIDPPATGSGWAFDGRAWRRRTSYVGSFSENRATRWGINAIGRLDGTDRAALPALDALLGGHSSGTWTLGGESSEGYDVDAGGSGRAVEGTAQAGAVPGAWTVAVELYWSGTRTSDGSDLTPGCDREPTGGAVELTGGDPPWALHVRTDDECDGCLGVELDGEPFGAWCGSALPR